MTKTTICLALLVAVSAPDLCIAQSDATDIASAFIPEPGEFLPKGFRETEQDRKRLARVQINLREEQQFGRQMAAAYLKWLKQQKIEVVQRGRDVEYLRSLTNELRPRMKHAKRYRNIRLFLAEGESIDARSFPGGTIVLNRGMLDFIQSEAAVVGVLAHELSHIDRAHQLDGLRRQKLAQQTLTDRRASLREFMSVGKLFTLQFMQPFHPEQETEADNDAAEWMADAGYDPLELARFFLRMHQRDPHRNRSLPRFLQSHPYDVDRFEAVRKARAEMAAENRAALYVGKENLKKRIPKHHRKFPE